MHIPHSQKTLAVAASAMLVSLFLSGVALASTYEWIKGMTIGTPVRSQTYVTTTWDVHTDGGTYYEYRSLYYATGTAPYVWHEWTDCRRQGNVAGEITDYCSHQYPYTSVTTTLIMRSSTNFTGCGTWTPTPDETNCGGTFTATTTLSP